MSLSRWQKLIATRMPRAVPAVPATRAAVDESFKCSTYRTPGVSGCHRNADSSGADRTVPDFPRRSYPSKWRLVPVAEPSSAGFVTAVPPRHHGQHSRRTI
jgi:hypothetical protein